MSDLIPIVYRPQGRVLAQYTKCRDFFHIIRGPLGAGKTYASVFKCLALCCEQTANKEGERKTRAFVVRNTYPDLLNTILKDFREIVPNALGSFTMGHPPELKLDFDLEDGTRVLADIMFLALDKEDDVRKIRGANITWAYINEARELARANIDMLSVRVNRYPKPDYSTWAGVFGDTNSWDKDHWLEKWAEAIKKDEMPGYRILVQPAAVVKVDGKWEVNPQAENLFMLKSGYYAQALVGKREDWIRVNLANEIGYSFDGKPVHPDYSDSVNCSPHDLIPNPGTAYVGLDFGLTPAAVFWQRQDDGQWWAFDELVATDMNNAEFAIELKARCAKHKALVEGARRGATLQFMFRGDPAGDQRAMTDGRTTFAIYRAAGIHAIPCSSNDVQLRRAALSRVLTRTVKGRPGMLISPKCSMLRQALTGKWCYKRVQVTGSERYKDVAEKNEFSHVGEAAEYGLLDAGENVLLESASQFNAPSVRPAINVKANWDVFKA